METCTNLRNNLMDYVKYVQDIQCNITYMKQLNYKKKSRTKITVAHLDTILKMLAVFPL